jgi:hypothetical protein
MQVRKQISFAVRWCVEFLKDDDDDDADDEHKHDETGPQVFILHS